MRIKPVFAYKLHFIIFAVALSSAFILSLRSSAAWRDRKAEDYLAANLEAKAIPLYYKIIRKENVSHKYRALSQSQLCDVYFMLGDLLLKERRVNEAMEVFSGLAKINKDYFKPLLSSMPAGAYDRKKSALCLARAGLIQMACRQIRDYCGAHDSDLQGHFLFGLFCEKAGDLTSAIKHFQRAASLAPANSAFLLAEIKYKLGKAYESTGAWQPAEKYYLGAIGLRPGYFFPRQALAGLYTRQARFPEARAMQESADRCIDIKAGEKVRGEIILRGYSIDEFEFNIFNEGDVAFFWSVAGKPGTAVSHEKNLSPDFGFELNYPGTGFPYGWDTDYYEADENVHRIVPEPRNEGSGQCLLLDNAGTLNTNTQSAYVSLEPGYYLQSGLMRSENGNIFFGRRWYDRRKMATTYDYAAMWVTVNDWSEYHQVLAVGDSAGYLRLWLTNSESKGKAYFDNILLVKLSLPQ